MGSSDTEATYRLLVNRETGAVFLAPLREADRVLREQWPQIAMEKPVSFTSQEELHELVQEAFELMRPMSQADIMEVMAQQEGRLAALRAALNRN
ncbi:MAG: hypothetical protein GY803_22340 [Chloroflexi bacterium]|nr:hypothetical protein [Chloroflexota bacterium]